MGTIIHDVIVVTSFDDKHINIARDRAIALGMVVSEVCASPMNHYRSFFIVPDGSKEWWADSDKGDARRAEWIAWADSAERRATVFFDWAAVRYGHDLETPPQVTGGTGFAAGSDDE